MNVTFSFSNLRVTIIPIDDIAEYTDIFSAIVVDENGVQTSNITMMYDDSAMTCATFTASKIQQTKMYKTSSCSADTLTVTTVGRVLGCDRDLYVVGMTSPDAGARRDRWTKCAPKWQATDQYNAEWCSFNCHCTGGCQQVMVAKWPKTLADSSWSLCDIRLNCDGRLYDVCLFMFFISAIP